MLTELEAKEAKERCLADLREAMPRYRGRLKEIEPRLELYALDCIREDIDIHNLDELLGLRKFLRMLDTYPTDAPKVRQVVSMLESLKLPSLHGYRHYPATMSQVYCIALIYLFHHWVDTRNEVGTRTLLPSEREGKPQ